MTAVDNAKHTYTHEITATHEHLVEDSEAEAEADTFQVTSILINISNIWPFHKHKY